MHRVVPDQRPRVPRLGTLQLGVPTWRQTGLSRPLVTEPRGRVTADRRGRPVVRYRFTKEVIEAMGRATRTAARMFFAAGPMQVHAPPSADPPLIEARDGDRIMS